MRDDLKPTTAKASLGWLIEELSEALVECGHIMRFGVTAVDPKTNFEYSNLTALMNELEHAELAIENFRNVVMDAATLKGHIEL